MRCTSDASELLFEETGHDIIISDNMIIITSCISYTKIHLHHE